MTTPFDPAETVRLLMSHLRDLAAGCASLSATALANQLDAACRRVAECESSIAELHLEHVRLGDEVERMRPVVEASLAAREADSAEVGPDAVSIAELEPLAAVAVKRTQAALTRWRGVVDTYRAGKP